MLQPFLVTAHVDLNLNKSELVIAVKQQVERNTNRPIQVIQLAEDSIHNFKYFYEQIFVSSSF